MPGEKFTNVGVTYVAGTLPPGATTLNVTPGSGTVLPDIAAGEYFTLVLTSPSTGNIEVVRCTARNFDTLTIERAKEPVWGRPAEALQFEDGDEVRNAPSAAWYSRIVVDSELAAVSTELATEVQSRTTEDTSIRGDIANLQTQVDDRATVAQYEDNRTRVAQLGQSLGNAIDVEKGARAAADVSALALIRQLEAVNADTKLETLRVAVNANTHARQTSQPEFPAGTRMLFQQTTPPTGWTKITTFADHALRLTSGAADFRTRADYNRNGNVNQLVRTDFLDVFNDARDTFNVVLSQLDIPDHVHVPGTLEITGGTHVHREGGVHSVRAGEQTGVTGHSVIPNNSRTDGEGASATGAQRVEATRGDTSSEMAQFFTETDISLAQLIRALLTGATDVGHTHDVGGRTGTVHRTQFQGIGDPGHGHAFTMDVNYASVILAQKDAAAPTNVIGMIDANFVVA